MHVLAVVPIVTNLGVAVLPVVLAAIGSVVAILLKPRQLARLCWQRPAAFGSLLIGIAAIAVAGVWLFHANSLSRAANRSDRSTSFRYDWAKIAKNIIDQQHAGRHLTQLGLSSPASDIGVPASADHLALSHSQQDCSANPVQQATAASSDGVATLSPPPSDFHRCNYHGGKAPLHLASLWSFQPEDTMFLSNPAISNDRVFVAGCQSDLGAYVGLLACLNPQTGQPIWQISQLGDEPLKPFFSSPAISADGKSLIIGEGLHEDRDCSLRCYDTATGKLRWSVKTPLHVESSPAIFGNLVVVGAGAIEGPDGKATGDPGFVFAVRISDGKELWRFAVNDPESSPAIAPDGTVYIGSGFNGNAFVALRSESDEELRQHNLNRLRWRVSVPLPITGTVTLADDLAIVGGGNADIVHSNRDAQGIVVAVNRKTGQTRWQARFDDGVLGEIAAYRGRLICPIRTGEIVALDQASGKKIWRTRVSGSAPIMAGCAVAENRIYAISSDGYLAILNAKDGAILEKRYLNDSSKSGSGLTLSAPQLYAGKLLVGSETGGFHCFGEVGSR